MGPGREPKLCENDELVSEFEFACRSGDYEFADEYKAEIIRRLQQTQAIPWRQYDPENPPTERVSHLITDGRNVDTGHIVNWAVDDEPDMFLWEVSDESPVLEDRITHYAEIVLPDTQDGKTI